MPVKNTSQTSHSGIQISQKMSLGRASLLLAAMIALSRVAGFGRVVLTSYLYGISPETDAYNAAFNIPDTISILIAGGALATGFVPVFTEYLSKGQEEAARRTFRAMLTILFVAFGVLTIVLFALTYTPAGTLLAPKDVQPQVVDLYLRVLRILLFAQFIFVIGGLFTGVLNALRLFWYPALQPVVFNLGIIAFGIALPQMWGMGIESQAWGALAGAIIGSLCIQVPAIRRNGLTVQPLWDLNDAGVQRVLRSLLPIVFGLSSGQIIALSLPRFFAIGLSDGDLTALDNANRLMQVPLAVLAAGPAIALYPTLSLLSAEGKLTEMRAQLANVLRRTLLLMMLATALMMALGFSIIHLLLEHGRFGPAETRFTASVLFCYAIGLLGLGAQQLLARGFYAMGNTRAPVTVGVLTMLLFGAMALGTMHFTNSGAHGLATSSAASITFLGAFMWLVLRYKLGGWDDGATGRAIVKGAVASVACYFAALYVQRWTSIQLGPYDTDVVPGVLRLSIRAIIVVAGTLAGTGAFLIVARVLGIEGLSRGGKKGAGPKGDGDTPPKKRKKRSSRYFEAADLPE